MKWGVWMKKTLGTVLIILGLAIAVFPFAGRLIADQRQKAMMEAFYLEAEADEQVSEDYSELDSVFDSEGQEALEESVSEGVVIETGETDDAEEGGTTELLKSMTLGERPETIGIMNIPKISLRTPIAEGADLDILRFAIGHMKGTAGLGEIGNSVIAGHRSHSFGVYFNRLDEMENGDEILVEAGGRTITYVVYDKLIVEPDDLSVLGSSSKYRVLTLITCDPVYNPTHRLIVHAVDKEQLDN